jgi:hypothetical protein
MTDHPGPATQLHEGAQPRRTVGALPPQYAPTVCHVGLRKVASWPLKRPGAVRYRTSDTVFDETARTRMVDGAGLATFRSSGPADRGRSSR